MTSASNIPSTMKAVHRKSHFDSSYAWSDTYPVPSTSLKPDEVLIKVQAAAINPADYKAPKALLGDRYGLDFSGTVVQVGTSSSPQSSVSEGDANSQSTHRPWKVGDIVFGFAQGTLCEYTVAKASHIAKVPSDTSSQKWSMAELAALPVVYATAITGWKKVNINLDEPSVVESMLIIGASGGCGLAAIQLAKGLGVKRITGICSSKNADLVKENGATEVIPYNDKEALDQFWKDNAGQFDHIYDSASHSGAGEDYTKIALAVLKLDGSCVVLNGGLSNFLGFAMGGRGYPDKRQVLIFTKHSTEQMNLIVSLLNKAQRKPLIDTMSFSDENCRAGLAKLKSRRAIGKIVFEIDE